MPHVALRKIQYFYSSLISIMTVQGSSDIDIVQNTVSHHFKIASTMVLQSRESKYVWTCFNGEQMHCSPLTQILRVMAGPP